MNEQPTLSSTTPGGAPWTSDATKNSTLATLRAAYPKSTPFGASITCDMAWAMVRGQPGFAPTPIFGVDVEADGLAYVRYNWSGF